MSLGTLQLIATVGGFLILFCLSVLATVNDFRFSKVLCIVGWIATLLSIFIIPTSIDASYNKNKEFTEDVVATYELLSEENEKFVTVSGGKFSYPYVCYEDSNDTIKTLKLDNSVKIVRNSDEAKLEKVKVKWGIVEDTAYILYLPD